MGRYTGSVCRLCRREGEKLFLKGARCMGPKCALEKKAYPPGIHTRRSRPSNYGQQLREKQKVKRIYGVRESQFKSYFQKAARSKGVTGQRLLELLETRLDNVVYRAGFAHSRKQARQLVNHGHITVDGRKVDIPSFQTKQGSIIGLTASGERSELIKLMLKEKKKYPGWIKFNAGKNTAEVIRLPLREEVEARIEEQYIVEYYSR